MVLASRRQRWWPEGRIVKQHQLIAVNAAAWCLDTYLLNKSPEQQRQVLRVSTSNGNMDALCRKADRTLPATLAAGTVHLDPPFGRQCNFILALPKKYVIMLWMCGLQAWKTNV